MPPEQWDLLDGEGRPTGGLAVRGEPLGAGDRHLVVHVHLVNPEGRFLVQKRSLRKELWPGAWDVTGGAVQAGEDSLRGAIREVQEELGIRLQPEDLTFMARLKAEDHFADLWLGRIGARIQEMTMQPEEVDDLRFVAAEDLKSFILPPWNDDAAYLAAVEDMVLACVP
jgi:8-oxo-dGTP diphosphatase